MTPHLCRNRGLYQWDASVAGAKAGKARERIKVTVFCDSRSEAIEAASQTAQQMGLAFCTVDHITKVG